MTQGRVSQTPTTVLVQPDTQTARVSQELATVLVEPDAPGARPTQVLAAVLVLPDNRVFASDLVITVLIGNPPPQPFMPVWVK